ncbi:tail protein [Dickeya phage Sucellus]|nr:tail protein [Dickeya phage Sucellus]
MADNTLFPFSPSPGVNVRSEPRLKVSTFGDGYEQRKTDGINYDQKEYDLNFILSGDDIQVMRDFLELRHGVISFMFNSPVRQEPVRVICKKWTEENHKFYSKFSATFNEISL